MKTKTYKTGAAECAAAVRVELKKAFPKIKFSVRSSTFSMGNSVGISWTNGPTTAMVDAITDRFQYGTFDSMTDCAGVKENFTGPGARFVSTHREISQEMKDAARARIAKEYDLTEAEAASDYNSKTPESMYTMVYRYFQPVDLTDGLAAADDIKAKAEAAKEADYQTWLASDEAADFRASQLAAQAYKENGPPVLVVLPRAAARCTPGVFMFRQVAGVPV